MSDAPSRPAAGATRARRWGPLLAWTTLLVVATSWPNPNVPDVRDGDKVVHALLYGVLAWLAFRAAFWNGRRAHLNDRRAHLNDRRAHVALRVAAIVGAASALGWVDEWHQQFIPGRSRSTADWQADTAGALCGAVAAALGRRRAPQLS